MRCAALLKAGLTRKGTRAWSPGQIVVRAAFTSLTRSPAAAADAHTHRPNNTLNTTASREGDDPPPEPPLAHRQSHSDGVTSLVD